MTARVPRIETLETHWRMTGPSGRMLECGIYRVLTEVRVGYGPADLLRCWQAVPDIGAARDLAEQWRQFVLARGVFEELSQMDGVDAR